MASSPHNTPVPAFLMLADGYIARGRLIGRPGTTLGKLVFNTSMMGYQEILTDPSYAGEIITFTFPLIGIYGVAEGDHQSRQVFARGVVVSELSASADNWRADRTLNDMLMHQGLTGISGIDTRRLTRHLREQGEMAGIITCELSEDEARARLGSAPDFGSVDFVSEVSTPEPYVIQACAPDATRFGAVDNPRSDITMHSGGSFTVAAYDFGIKRGILDCLAQRGCTVHVFPSSATADELLAVSPDGVFLANGPGDPERMDAVLPHIQRLVEELPVFGICLGHQLIARAMGIPTYKLKFGNRGGNHPVLDLQDGRVHISAQNHSYAVELDGSAAGRPAAAADGRERAPLGDDRPTGPVAHPLNPRVLVTHLNVNDGSCEGLRLADRPVFSVQYHPEGCPGPRDNTYLFDEFCRNMAAAQAAAVRA
ncbi:MAG: glutamine-hydrolyzing carbamoyl-phosphate synthase small subunit [bacterium]